MSQQEFNFEFSAEQQRYSNFVASRAKKLTTAADDFMHAAVGISGEAGELLDTVKKHWVYGKPLDVDNIIEELGDIEFYMQALRNMISVSREEIIEANIAKLQKRYPLGYTDAAAIARADKTGETES